MSTPEDITAQEQPTASEAPAQPVAPLLPGFPVWSWIDFLGVTGLTILALVACIFLAGVIVGVVMFRTGGAPASSGMVVLGIAAQGIAYSVMLFYIAHILRQRSGETAMKALHWNSTPKALAIGILGGIALALVTMVMQTRLPIPKELPIEQLFKGTWNAYSFAIFAVLLAPLFEEVYFRGLMFPLVRRALGGWLAILITSAAFAMIHSVQLAFSWSALLSVFFVGLVLTVVRARFKSVAASWMVHVAYNTTLMATLWVSSEGFTHFEKLK